jgi:hypothetical protein
MQPIATSSKYPEAAVTKLMQLGFGREQVIETLDSCKGDENSAQILLLAKSLQVPKRK